MFTFLTENSFLGLTEVIKEAVFKKCCQQTCKEVGSTVMLLQHIVTAGWTRLSGALSIIKKYYVAFRFLSELWEYSLAITVI